MTNSQEQAINKTHGPTIILAGAGTGKSFTIRKKIQKLVFENIYKPEEILCLTFSNEAVNSLKTKISEDLKSLGQVTVKTFHSFCADILREDGHLIKQSTDFDLLLPDDASILLHKYAKIEPYWASRYVKTISSIKDLGINFQDINDYLRHLETQLRNQGSENISEEYQKKFLELQTLHLRPKETKEEKQETALLKKSLKKYIELYEEYSKFQKFITASDKYHQLKKERNYLDFSDLNELVLELFTMFDSKKYVEKYKYVFIDEFQDTNKLQFQLIEFIAKHHNITVVGDRNQSIYGFRGSYKKSFEHFKETFNVNENTDIFYLEKSYRNPNNVLNTSHELIKNNYDDPNDCIHISNANNDDGKQVQVIETQNAVEEARYIANYVEEAIANGVEKNEICILFRTHQQSEILREALESKNIPVLSSGRTSLLHRREITTVISYLSILSNLYSRSGTGDQAWWGLFHYHNTLSPQDSIKIGRYLNNHREEKLGIDEALLCASEKINLSSQGKKIIQRTAQSITQLAKQSNLALPDLILHIYEVIGLNRAFSYERTIQNLESLMNLKHFHDLAKNFYRLHEKTLPAFIEYLEIIEKMGVTISPKKIENASAVNLMTIHAVKGLEFKRVIVTNMAQDRFPVTRTQNEPLIPVHLRPHIKAHIQEWKAQGITDKELEQKIKDYDKKTQLDEERRLAYVAFTRTKEELLLLRAKSYNDEKDSASASTFLEEINYKENPAINYQEDLEEESGLFTPSSAFEEHKKLLKKQLIESLDAQDLPTIVEKLMYYLACRDKKTLNINELLNKINIDQEELAQHLQRAQEEKSLLVFDKEITLSPTALMTYNDCPKKFELQHLLRMPQQGDFDTEINSAGVGSFIHLVLENGVNKNFQTKEEFIQEAKKLQEQKDWQTINLEDIQPMINIFWERNKNKYSKESICEMKLPFQLEEFKFYGIADRVDIFPDKSVEIIDYKSNKNDLEKEKRELQLGFYALALQTMGYKIKKLSLEMLKLPQPVEYEITPEGIAKDCIGTKKPFKLEDVKEKILSLANKIKNDYENTFQPTTEENNCRFCKLKFYCPKWGEK